MLRLEVVKVKLAVVGARIKPNLSPEFNCHDKHAQITPMMKIRMEIIGAVRTQLA
jgi:hypothetical protein